MFVDKSQSTVNTSFGFSIIKIYVNFWMSQSSTATITGNLWKRMESLIVTEEKILCLQVFILLYNCIWSTFEIATHLSII